MSTLLEKPAAISAPPALAPVVLQSRHQWLHWRGVLIAGIIGLAATLLALWLVPASWHTAHLDWLAALWCTGLFLTLIAVVIAYAMAPGSILATAQKLDTRYAAKNRLEAIATLKDPNSPLAEAIRAETARFLQRETEARPSRALPWLLGVLIALVVAHLLSLLLWLAPVLHSISKSTPPLPQQQPPTSQENPKAAITWKSPDPETRANPSEEIPITATVDSPTGLQNLTLEISVNGEVKKSVPLPVDNTPGSHEVKTSISLDELKVKPFDVVSYYLHGQSNSAEKTPDITSSLQFIQVSPFRDDTKANSASVEKAQEMLNQLELAQLHLEKENFDIAHADTPAADPARQQENTQIGKDQTDLAAKAEDAAKALTADGYPSAMTDQLRQTEPVMNDAGKKIDASQNESALAPQEKALDFIAAVEKSSAAAPLAGNQNPPGSDPNNPFQDTPKPPAVPQAQTPSGELETLAKHQTDLAQDLGKDADSAPVQPSATAQPTPEPTPAPTPVASPAPTPAVNGASTNPPNGTPNNPAVTPPPAPAASANPAPAPAAVPTPVPTPPPVDPFSSDAEKGTIAERETRILQGIDTLQSGNKDLPEKVSEALSSAQTNANEAMKDLAADQNTAAQEPAATAARDLQQAAQAMSDADAAQARQALAEAQQQLNDQATRLREMAEQKPAPAPADASPKLMNVAEEVHDVQSGLEAAANHQQAAGSAQGAAPLDHLAQQLQDQKIAPDLADMSKSGLDAGRANALADKLEAAAGQAAQGSIPTQPSAQDYASLADALERSRANLAHLAEKVGGSPTDASPDVSGSDSSQHSDSGTPSGQGQSSSTQPGTAPGQTPGSGSPSSTPSATPSGQTPGGAPSPNAPSGSNPTPSTAGSSEPLNPATAEAYHEAVENLKNQLQQTSSLAKQDSAAADLEKTVIRYDKDTSYRNLKGVDVVKFNIALQQPLEKLITDLQSQQDHAQRTEVVKTPNLDETPAAYRPAVSDYFEHVSRDYHPPAAAPPANSKP